MDAFAPEFSQHWLAGQAALSEERSGTTDELLSPAQQEAWEELAERVSAANRSYRCERGFLA